MTIASWRNAKLFLVAMVLLFSGLVSLTLSVSASNGHSTAAVDAPWAYQNQNQQNTGYSPQTEITSSNVGELSMVWSTAIGGLSGTPVVVNGIVYVTGSNSIWAVNEMTGKIIWVDGPKTGLEVQIHDESWRHR